MNENINLCEILKDCPKWTKFYSPLFGEITFIEIIDYVNSPFPILMLDENRIRRTFSSDGRYDTFNKECLLFPSKEQRDWNKWKRPKPKFDPNTLKPFDRVLSYHMAWDKGAWMCRHFSHLENDRCYLTNGSYTHYCIPYNDETKHLVGTSNEAPEYYRYLED